MKHLTIGVDTNVFLHYGQIKLLDWRKIFNDVTHLRILVARQVQREMDDLKDKGKGYLQTRAREYQRLLLESEEKDYVVSFQHLGIEVSVVFLRHTRNSNLDGDLFDLTSPDQKIVAEYHRAADGNTDFIVFANDTGTVMTARDAKMRTERPEPAWGRVEPEDEAVKSLREENLALRRQVGSAPKIEIANFSAEVVQRVPTGFKEGFDIQAYLKDLDRRIAETTFLSSVGDLVKRHGLERPDRNGFTVTILTQIRLSLDQVEEYQRDLDRFDYFFQNMPPTRFLTLLRELATPHLVEIEIANLGSAMEERVCVEIALHKNCVLWPPSGSAEDNDWGLSKPEEPSPLLSLSPALYDLADPRAEETHDHEFGDPEVLVRGQRFRCRAILHGHSARVSSVITHQDGDENDPSEIMVSVFAAKLVEPIKRKVTFRREFAEFDGSDIDMLIASRTKMMHGDQAEILARAMKVCGR